MLGVEQFTFTNQFADLRMKGLRNSFRINQLALVAWQQIIMIANLHNLLETLSILFIDLLFQQLICTSAIIYPM